MRFQSLFLTFLLVVLLSFWTGNASASCTLGSPCERVRTLETGLATVRDSLNAAYTISSSSSFFTTTDSLANITYTAVGDPARKLVPGKTIVLMHGYISSRTHFAQMQRNMALDGYYTVSYDRRGYADSTRLSPTDVQSTNSAAEDLLQLLTTLDLKSPVLFAPNLAFPIVVKFHDIYSSTASVGPYWPYGLIAYDAKMSNIFAPYHSNVYVPSIIPLLFSAPFFNTSNPDSVITDGLPIFTLLNAPFPSEEKTHMTASLYNALKPLMVSWLGGEGNARSDEVHGRGPLAVNYNPNWALSMAKINATVLLLGSGDPFSYGSRNHMYGASLMTGTSNIKSWTLNSGSKKINYVLRADEIIKPIEEIF